MFYFLLAKVKICQRVEVIFFFRHYFDIYLIMKLVIACYKLGETAVKCMIFWDNLLRISDYFCP